MIERLARLIKDDRGVSAVEYGLIAALIVMAMLAGLSQVANTTTGMWNNVAEVARRHAPV